MSVGCQSDHVRLSALSRVKQVSNELMIAVNLLVALRRVIRQTALFHVLNFPFWNWDKTKFCLRHRVGNESRDDAL